MTIDNELKVLVSMSSLHLPRETFVTTVCNALGAAVQYSKAKNSILTKDAWKKSFVHNLAKDAYAIQGWDD